MSRVSSHWEKDRLGPAGLDAELEAEDERVSIEQVERAQEQEQPPPLEVYAEERQARANGGVEPLDASSVSNWARRPAPPPRDWIVENLIPAGRVTSFLGTGGLGKSIIAGQIGVHVASDRPLFGFNVKGGPVLALFCEDEPDELERRIRAAVAGESLSLEALDNFYAISRDGMDNLLCTFDHDHIVLTSFYSELEATVAQIRPRLLILDVAADFFGGDYLSTSHVRQFIKVALGRLCVTHGCAVLLLAHPSASAQATGDGGGFSVAWHNSVRSRLYVRQPKVDEPEAGQDRRVLEVRKSNYGPRGLTIPLRYQGGCFVLDPEPAEEVIPGGSSERTVRARPNTRLALAAIEHVRRAAPSGQVVTFHAIFEPIQKGGLIERGPYEMVRKPLQRAIKQLVEDGLLIASKVPRGYRLAHSPEANDVVGWPRPTGDTGLGTGHTP